MKKLLSLILTLSMIITVGAIPASAAENTISGAITFSDTAAEDETFEVTLEAGTYDITAYCTNTSVADTSYISVAAAGYTDAQAVIPVLTETGEVKLTNVTTDDGALTVTVHKGADTELVIEKIVAEPAASDKEFLKGGDITELIYVEDMGGKFYNAEGEEEDAVKILADNGMNLARIRLYNNPGKGRGDGTYYIPDGYQDEEDCLELARRAKEYGMKIQFTFHYSDYWSNGTREIIPADWVEAIKSELGYDVKDADFLNSMTDDERAAIIDKLTELVYNYTYDIMTKLKDQGTTPEYVTLGNETNGGMLFPFANTYAASMNRDNFELVFGDDVDPENDIVCPEDWDALAKIMNAGYDAVKAVSPDTQVGMHLAEGSKSDIYDWWLQAANNAGIKYDYVGASYYPAWSNNTVDTAVWFCNYVTETYDTDILIMETGYNWYPTRQDGYPGQLVDIDAYADIYPSTKEGHKGFMAELFNGLKNVDGGRCIGDIYWDPMMIHCDGVGWAYSEETDEVEVNVVENTTLFDFDGVALPSLDVFKYNQAQRKALGDNLSLEYYERTANAIKADIKNSGDTAATVAVYTADYTADGTLAAVTVREMTIEPNKAGTFEVNTEQPTDGYSRAYAACAGTLTALE